jgi:hypothetical protein
MSGIELTRDIWKALGGPTMPAEMITYGLGRSVVRLPGFHQRSGCFSCTLDRRASRPRHRSRPSYNG